MVHESHIWAIERAMELRKELFALANSFAGDETVATHKGGK